MKGFGEQQKSKKKSNKKAKLSKEQIINQAIQFHSQGNIQEAAKYYQYCINQDFNDHRVFSNFAVILQGIGKLEEAELSTRKAIEIKPDLADAHYNLGIILKDLGKLQDAELSYSKAIEIKPDYAEAHYNLGNLLKDLGKLQDAELSYSKAIEIKPDYADAHYNLGIILKDLGKLQDAELSYSKAIEIKPDYAEAHYNLGNLLKDLGKLQDAELSYSKAIEIKPDLAVAHSNLGIILKDLGKLQDAEISTRKAIELNPDFAEAHTNLGTILRDLGNLQDAELSYSKAIEIKSDWQTYFFYAGCIFQRKEFEVVTNILLEAQSLNLENHQKAYINAALKATTLAKNNSIFSTNLNISKGSKSLINKSKNKLVLNRLSRDELINYLYSVNNQELNNTIDARYGKGFCSQDLSFFDDQSPIISNLSDHFQQICKEALGLTEIFICESFFNIFKSGSNAGAKQHSHIGKRDSCFGLTFNKYSLIYYLEIGDQSGEDPGILKLYEPYEEILPTNDMLIIIGAERKHSVSYCGNKDRVVISANFYGF